MGNRGNLATHGGRSWPFRTTDQKVASSSRTTNYDEGEIHCAAQLFLNREIWAFNTSFLSPDLARARSNTVLGVPTLAVEQTFAIHLPRYARFMNDALGVPPPYRIEGGAFGVKDYVLFMGSPTFQVGSLRSNLPATR